LKRKCMAVVYQIRMSVAHRRNPRSGEECILKAER
jgi:hypothetical protein